MSEGSSLTLISNTTTSSPQQFAVGQVMRTPDTYDTPMGMALNSLGMISTSHTDIKV